MTTNPKREKSLTIRFKEFLDTKRMRFTKGRKAIIGDFKKIHGHMICRECKRVIEFDSEEIKNFLEKLAQRNKFSIGSVEIEVIGICKNHED